MISTEWVQTLDMDYAHMLYIRLPRVTIRVLLRWVPCCTPQWERIEAREMAKGDAHWAALGMTPTPKPATWTGDSAGGVTLLEESDS
jgi:hypothetical protein